MTTAFRLKQDVRLHKGQAQCTKQGKGQRSQCSLSHNNSPVFVNVVSARSGEDDTPAESVGATAHCCAQSPGRGRDRPPRWVCFAAPVGSRGRRRLVPRICCRTRSPGEGEVVGRYGDAEVGDEFRRMHGAEFGCDGVLTLVLRRVHDTPHDFDFYAFRNSSVLKQTTREHAPHMDTYIRAKALE